MGSRAHRTPTELADRVLAPSTYRARLRELVREAGSYTPELAQELIARAREAVREDPRDALQRALLARIVAAQTHDTDGWLDAVRAAGQACAVLGRFASALRAFDAALEVARENGDEERLAAFEMLRLDPLAHLERHEEARETGRRLLGRFGRKRDREGCIRTHMALALLEFRVDRPRAALRHYAAVDRLLSARTSARFRAVLAANRANALEACNRFRAAERQFERARELLTGQGLEHTLAQVDYNAAFSDLLRGRYEQALRGYARTAELFRQLRDERHLALIDLERAEIHLRLNLPQEALTLAKRAERSFAGSGLRKEAALAARTTGEAAALLGDADSAEVALSRAQNRFTALDLPERRLACLVRRSELALAAGRLDDARWLVEEAASLDAGGFNPLSLASVELLRARLELARGDPGAALRRADDIALGCRRIHAPGLKIEAHRLAGRAYAARGQLDEAILAYEHAVDELERYRAGVPADEYMAAFLSGRADLYAEIVELLVRAGHPEMAFEFTERAKSRALADLLAGQGAGRRSKSGGSLAERRIEHLRERLNAVYHRLFRGGAGDEKRSARAVLEARRQASQLEEEVARLLREAHLRRRGPASLGAVDAPDLESVRKRLGEGTVLLEYLVTRDRLYTFVLSEDDLHVVRQDVAEDELRTWLARFRFHLAKFDRDEVPAQEFLMEATRANLARLAERLLAPVAEQLTGRRLVVVPHGILHGLPFHALPWGEGWVADRFEVVYAPSAAVYAHGEGRPRPARGGACILGLPDEVAPEMEREVRSVAEALGCERAYLGQEATLERLRADGRDARYVHIATHGMFRREQPMLSAIRLADTWLNLYDIYELELDAELVVLSACESGIADVTDGDEILGLTRGFLFAGARALLASQWRVHDAATADFMRRFYGELRRGGGAAAALQRTMAAVRAERPHPYYWAPFLLTGRPHADPRRTAPAAGASRHRQLATATTGSHE